MQAIIATSDWHIRRPTPIARKDEDFLETALSKVEYIVNYAKKHDCLLCIAGDLFDSARATIVPYEAVARLLLLLKDVPLVLAAGQHDMRYHQNSLENTPFQIIETVLFPDGRPKRQLFEINGEPIEFVTCDWGEEIPKPSQKRSVLVIHETILKGDENFAGVPAKELLEKTEYNLIISGDNHKRFVVKEKERLLINPGSLLRLTIEQKDFEPKFAVITPQENGFSIHWEIIPHDKDVFIERVEKEAEETKDLSEFIERLASEQVSKANFIEMVKKAAAEQGLKSLLEKILQAL